MSKSGTLYLKFSDLWVEKTCTLNFVSGDFALSDQNGDLNVKYGKFSSLSEDITGRPFSFQIDTADSRISLIFAAHSDSNFKDWQDDFSRCVTVKYGSSLPKLSATALAANRLDTLIERSSNMANAYTAPASVAVASVPVDHVAAVAEEEFSFADCYGGAEVTESPAPVSDMSPGLVNSMSFDASSIEGGVSMDSCPPFQLELSSMVCKSCNQLLRRTKLANIFHENPEIPIGAAETKRKLAQFISSDDAILKNLSTMEAKDWVGVLQNLRSLEESELEKEREPIPMFHFNVIDDSKAEVDEHVGTICVSMQDGVAEVTKKLSSIFMCSSEVSIREKVLELFDSTESPTALALKYTMTIIDYSRKYMTNQDVLFEKQQKLHESHTSNLKLLVSTLKNELKSTSTAVVKSSIPAARNGGSDVQATDEFTAIHENQLNALKTKLEDQDKQLYQMQQEYAVEFRELQDSFEEEIAHLKASEAENALLFEEEISHLKEINAAIAARLPDDNAIPTELDVPYVSKALEQDDNDDKSMANVDHNDYSMADVNGDGVISKGEWQAWMADKHMLLASHNEEKNALISEIRLLKEALSPSNEMAFSDRLSSQQLISTLEEDIVMLNISLDDVKNQLEVSQRRVHEQELQLCMIDTSVAPSSYSIPMYPNQTSLDDVHGNLAQFQSDSLSDHDNIIGSNVAEEIPEDQDSWLSKYVKALSGSPVEAGEIPQEHVSEQHSSTHASYGHEALENLVLYNPSSSPSATSPDNIHPHAADDSPNIFSLSSVTISPSYTSVTVANKASPKDAYLARTFYDYDPEASTHKASHGPKSPNSKGYLGSTSLKKVAARELTAPSSPTKPHHPLHQALLDPPSKLNPIGRGQLAANVIAPHNTTQHHQMDRYTKPTNSSSKRIEENNMQHDWQKKNSYKSVSAGFKFKK